MNQSTQQQSNPTSSSLGFHALGGFSGGLELLVRHEFGERYVSLNRIVFAFLSMHAFRFVFVFVLMLSNFSLAPSLFGGGSPRISFSATTPLFTLLSILVLVTGVWHMWRVFYRARKDIPWHSMSFGVSRLRFFARLAGINDWVLYRFVEPFLFIALGFGLYQTLDRLTGAWMMVSGLSLFIKNQMVFAEQRNRYLDTIDAKIESKYMGAAQAGASKKETAGYEVVPAPVGDMFETA